MKDQTETTDRQERELECLQRELTNIRHDMRGFVNDLRATRTRLLMEDESKAGDGEPTAEEAALTEGSVPALRREIELISDLLGTAMDNAERLLGTL